MSKDASKWSVAVVTRPQRRHSEDRYQSQLGRPKLPPTGPSSSFRVSDLFEVLRRRFFYGLEFNRGAPESRLPDEDAVPDDGGLLWSLRVRSRLVPIPDGQAQSAAGWSRLTLASARTFPGRLSATGASRLVEYKFHYSSLSNWSVPDLILVFYSI